MDKHVEQLEGRRLLSADLAAGVLTVTGTAKNDSIVVSLSTDGDTITVRETTQTSRFRKAKTTKTRFAAADVTSLVINAGAGNDTVALKGTRDTPFSLAAEINGEAGNDRLSGADGNDTISGGAGDDDLAGRTGDDMLNGDEDDDKLVAGDGADSLNGGAGDDFLRATEEDGDVDVLDGGEDSAASGEDDVDVALAEDTDTTSNASTEAPDDFLPGGGHGGGHGFFGHGGFGGRFGFAGHGGSGFGGRR